MKKFAAVIAMGLCFVTAYAAPISQKFTGFVQDSACAGKPSMKGDAECAKSCIKKGKDAVLVMPDGTIYKVANQSTVVPHAGETITLEGTLAGDTITVTKVE
jgi:hypothetical protein